MSRTLILITSPPHSTEAQRALGLTASLCAREAAAGVVLLEDAVAMRDPVEKILQQHAPLHLASNVERRPRQRPISRRSGGETHGRHDPAG